MSYFDAAAVQERLEQAGRTQIAMRLRSPVPREDLPAMWPEYVHTFADKIGWTIPDVTIVRAAVPSAAEIDAMDEAFGWLSLIPNERYVERRVVGLRSLIDPSRQWQTHCWSWRRIGELMNTSHECARNWHAQGIGRIVRALNRTTRMAA